MRKSSFAKRAASSPPAAGAEFQLAHALNQPPGLFHRQGLRLEPGDAVLVHTGWGRLWGTDNARYAAAGPGLGTLAAEWLADKGLI